MATLPWGSSLTVEDLEAIPDDGHRYELVDGTLLVTPAPDTRHQRCVTRLAASLVVVAGGSYDVLVAPYDWVVGPRTLFQPDVLVARRDEVGEKRLERAPALVVEVLSPSTRRVDLSVKRMAYADAGAASYWLVDPVVPSLTALRLEGGSYTELATVTGEDAWTAQEPFPVTIVPAALVR